MFELIAQTKQMLDNFGPTQRTASAPYPIVDCEKMSEAGLTCNSVIMSVMEPPGNNVESTDVAIRQSCNGVITHDLQPVCSQRPLETAATSATN